MQQRDGQIAPPQYPELLFDLVEEVALERAQFMVGVAKAHGPRRARVEAHPP